MNDERQQQIELRVIEMKNNLRPLLIDHHDQICRLNHACKTYNANEWNRTLRRDSELSYAVSMQLIKRWWSYGDVGVVAYAMAQH